MDETSLGDWRNLETVSGSAMEGPAALELRVPGLTILAHPDVRRIGERAVLTSLTSNHSVALSRLEPVFAAPGEARRRPLEVPHLSRQPLTLVAIATGGIRLLKQHRRPRVLADGVPVDQQCDFSAEDVERGVVLLLADRIALVLQPLDPAPSTDTPGFGLIGESPGIINVRQQMARVADLKVPALIRGETGTGKELVATGIHQASPRCSRPFVAVNMGAVPASLAAAELFGAARGAYTGANRHRTGYFARAEQGTLFLDEIGETPPEVQVLLLRTLESGVVQPVGAEKSLQVDVRILAATDADLESEITAGHFRAPLLHRLSGYEIRVPPLRERRDDIGRLLLHFLRQELEELGEPWRLTESAATPRPWLTAALAARLAAWSWPGNVRQLRNVARQLVIGNRGRAQLELVPEVEALIRESESSSSIPAPEDVIPENQPKDPKSSNRPKVKTVLLADLIDRRQLVESLIDPRYPGILRRHDQAARRLLLEYCGHEIDSVGRGLKLFDRPVDALGYALEYHETLVELSRDLGVDLKARVTIHMGEFTVQTDDLGEGAHGLRGELEDHAQQTIMGLASIASANQTLLTRSAFDLARQAAQDGHPLRDPEVRWLEHGRYELQGLREPVETYEVGVEGTAPLTAPVREQDVPEVAESLPDSSSRPRYRDPSEVTEDELLEALRDYQFRLQPTAVALRISRTSLYSLIDKSSRIRKARDLTSEEITRADEHCAGDLDAMAAELEVSRKGLRRRMTQLGLSPPTAS